jgi:hypothetical protein
MRATIGAFTEVRSGSEGCPDTGHGGKRILRLAGGKRNDFVSLRLRSAHGR